MSHRRAPRESRIAGDRSETRERAVTPEQSEAILHLKPSPAFDERHLLRVYSQLHSPGPAEIGNEQSVVVAVAGQLRLGREEEIIVFAEV